MIVDASTASMDELLGQLQDDEICLLVSEGEAKAVVLSIETFEALTASLDDVEGRRPSRKPALVSQGLAS